MGAPAAIIAATLASGLALAPASAPQAPDRMAVADRVVAAAWDQGGYPLPNTPAYRRVRFTLYADGRLLRPDGEDAHGVTAYAVADLDRSEAMRLRRALSMATAGIDFGIVPVPDAPHTRTRVSLRGREVHATVNALVLDEMITDAQRAARVHLRAVLQRADSFAHQPWAPAAYEVRRLPVDEASIALEWPGPVLPPGECGTIPAEEYGAFPESFAQGNAYTADGRAFALWVRPLLPGQQGCRGY